MLYIDNQAYDVEVIKLKRKAEFLDSSSARRYEDGSLFRDLIGVYYNYDLTLGYRTHKNAKEYDRLWDKLTEPAEFHSVTVPYNGDSITFTAYFSNISDELLFNSGQNSYWKGLTVNFIAKEPARR